MNGRQLWQRIRRIWIIAGLSVTAAFVGWSLVAYRASASARIATRPDAAVDVRHQDGIWYFLPRPQPPATTPALVFFPGALVDPVAYAPLLRAAAEAGFPAYLIELPRRGAFGGADDPELERRLDRLLIGPDAPRRWVVGGHSRGAVVACQVAAEHRTGFTALILIGTSHPRDLDLSALAVPVIKIAGTRDGLASPEEIEANRSLLPDDTRWLWIEGGNHSQFGWYGFQPGDRRATVSAETQHGATITAVLDVLKQAVVDAPAS